MDNELESFKVKTDELYDAIDRAYFEIGVNSVKHRATATRIFNNVLRLYPRYLWNDTIDIYNLTILSDKELVGMGGLGPESIRILRRAFEILKGADPIVTKTYQVTINSNDIYLLKKMLEHRKNEVRLLQKLIDNAIEVE